tara:strand:+ start:28114 stop:29838 length:1725 start_codon:yes stop_codon:yes gene_type:complete
MNLQSKTILGESWQQLTEDQKFVISEVEKSLFPIMEELVPILEAPLTLPQIQQIFQAAEQEAKASGNNRTTLGKGADAATGAVKLGAQQISKLNSVVNDLGAKLKDTTPVQGLDQKFNQLKVDIKQKLQGSPAGQKVLTMVDKYGQFAKNNPAKSAFIIGVLTTVAAFAGGPAGGAAAGLLLRSSNNLIKGDDLSTAVGKGVKTAAIGAIVGAVADAIGDAAEAMYPPEITDTFIGPTGEIDVSAMAGMDASALADLSPEEAMELIKARTAMEGMANRLSSAEFEVLKQQMDQIDQKLVQLGDGGSVQQSIDNIQDQLGIEGEGLQVKVQADDVSTDDAPDPESTGAEGTVVSEFSASELNELGVDIAEQPDLPDNVIELLKDNGLDDEQINAIQNGAKFEKALVDQEFLGQKISSSDSLSSWSGTEPRVIEELDGEFTEGETFRTEIETKLPGSDKTLTYSAESRVEGVDEDGNIVYELRSIFAGPETFSPEAYEALDSLPDDVKDKVMSALDDYESGYGSELLQSDSNEVARDAFEKFLQGSAAVAVGGALAKAEYKPKNESIERLKHLAGI